MRVALMSEDGARDDEDVRELPGIRRMRLRGGEGEEVMAGGVACCCACFVFGILFCTASLGPNTYGLMQNTITRNVKPTAYRGGLHFVGPIISFLQFPATAVTVEFSNHPGANGKPISTRTGADRQDGSSGGEDSGGQAIWISAAFQYKFQMDNLFHVYKKFGGMKLAQDWYELQGSNMIGNSANDFSPQQFWTERAKVADVMFQKVSKLFSEKGNATLIMFEIMKVEFTSRYEDSITKIQVAEQMRTVEQYNQSVIKVQQSIEVLKAHYTAKIANISARASAQAREIEAEAKKDAFDLKQSVKAEQYRGLKETLEFSADQMTTYFKIKSLQSQAEAKGAHVVVGMKDPTTVASEL